MGEKVRAYGVRAVKQKLVTTLDEMYEFLKTLSPTGEQLCVTAILEIFIIIYSSNFVGEVKSDMPLRCVVKPVQSAGSDDVYLCKTVAEAEVRVIDPVRGILNVLCPYRWPLRLSSVNATVSG
jgi:hypothetical protein